MMRSLSKLALCTTLSILIIPPAAFAGRGGGMQRGGGGYGGGGAQRGGGGYGGGASHSPSMSQPRRPSGESGNGSRSSSANSGDGNRNAGSAAAGADYANRNQSPDHSNAGAAAAGAGYANRNNSNDFSNAGAAAAGAGYANRNQYDQYHPGMAAGTWNGNYGVGNVGAYGGMTNPAAAYGYGSTPYSNPYAGGGQSGGQAQPATAQPVAASSPDYTQPLDTSAPPPKTAQADPAASPAAQARSAFKTGDYATAQQLTQQALGQMPNDVSLHEFLALDLFAQGSYEDAAAPLYAVLTAAPGWNWTTLIGNYADADVYTGQFRGLQAFVKANPKSAKAQFVLAYHYLSQGHTDAAIKPLENVVALQPSDTLSTRLLAMLQPAAAADPTTTTTPAESLDPAKLVGAWVAQAPGNTMITLTLTDAGSFSWDVAATGKPPLTISGPSSVAGNILTLAGKDTPGGPLAGQVTLSDDKHMNFKAVGGPASDPGLQFSR